jgi:hypothetical protein
MAILLVVMIGVLSAISFAYTSSTDTEMRNIATNVASYTLEYLRARTITRGTSTSVLTALGITSISMGTYGWYVPGTGTGTNATGAFPSMVDQGNLPLQSNGYPCNYDSATVRTGQKDGDANLNDTDGAAIVARSQVIRFASKHAARVAYVDASSNPIAAETYVTAPLAFTSTLQGYVSVKNMTDPVTTQYPALEDKNLAQMHFSAGSTASGIYRTLLTNKWTGLIVRYPGVYPSTAPVIASFTPGSIYLAKVYTTDTDTTGLKSRVSPNSQEYNPYYTSTNKAATQDYRGFRVLTQAVARTAAPATYSHVQYYDVTVIVLWMNGTHESNYELVSQIAAY